MSRASVGRMAALVTLLSVSVADAYACRLVSGDDNVADGLIMLPDQEFPWVRLYNGGNGRNGPTFEGCPANSTVEVQFNPRMPGLSYVVDVEYAGRMFPAFGWSPTSPLIILNLYRAQTGAPSETSYNPVRADRPTTIPLRTGLGGSPLTLSLNYVIFSRGHAMTSVPPVVLEGTTILPGFPSNLPLDHSLSFELGIAGRTCTLADTHLRLAPINAEALLAVGATGGEQKMDVMMQCPREGIPVTLTLRDAGNSSASGSLLTPTTNSTSRGVAIQLLRDGTPTRFGESWSGIPSVAGQQSITLSARYFRTADALIPGTLEGQAVLNADYR